MKRQIIRINEEKCNGCGLCVPDCPEGALQIIEGKARLVSDLFCDGLGACIGNCPQGAIETEEREAEPYDETRVMNENIIPKGAAVIKAHLQHLRAHGEHTLLARAHDALRAAGHDPADFAGSCPSGHGCPSSQERVLTPAAPTGGLPAAAQVSQLRQWPVQLKLVNPDAGWLDNARLLICADCVPFALPDLHSRYMQGRVVINLCPKLDPYIDEYIDKLTRIFQTHEIESVLVLRMEVPCCGGAVEVVRRAIAAAGRVIPLETVTIALDGSRL